MSSEHISPRVNSALFPKYKDRVVRLVCKILAVHGDRVTVMASDGGELLVQLTRDQYLSDVGSYVELIGSVLDSNIMKLLTCINLSQELDMTIVDNTIRLMHDPRYASKFWGPA